MVQLYTYQEKTLDKALEIFKEFSFVCLSAEMRTGKTLMALNMAHRLGAGSVLVITKKNAIPDIQKDVDVCGLPLQVEVINYESMHKIKNTSPDLVICDEYHTLGWLRKPSLKAKNFWKLTGGLPFIAMTGTLHTETFSTSYSLFPFEFYEYKNFYRWFDAFGVQNVKYFNGVATHDYSEAKRGSGI